MSDYGEEESEETFDNLDRKDSEGEGSLTEKPKMDRKSRKA